MKCVHGMYDERCCSHCCGFVKPSVGLRPSRVASLELVTLLLQIGAKTCLSLTSTGTGYHVYFKKMHAVEVSKLTLSPVSTRTKCYSQISCKDAFMQLQAARV